jgi:hypothetical protein
MEASIMFELYYFKVWKLFAGNYYCIISFEFLAFD